MHRLCSDICNIGQITHSTEIIHGKIKDETVQDAPGDTSGTTQNPRLNIRISHQYSDTGIWSNIKYTLELSTEQEEQQNAKKGKDVEEFTGRHFPSSFDIIWRSPDVFQTNTKGSYLQNNQKPRRHHKTEIHWRNVRSWMQIPIRNPIWPRKKHPLYPMVNPGTNHPIQKLQQNREYPRIYRNRNWRKSKRPRTCILHCP